LATPVKIEYYEVLGVGKNATQGEIRNAFQLLADAFKASGKPRNIDDVEEIRAIATAYRVLSDPEKRDRYDRLGLAFIGDAGLARAKDRLDELLAWLEERARQSD
jgi:molecular chaperone DnaJ